MHNGTSMLLALTRCAVEGGVVFFFFFWRQHQVVYTRATTTHMVPNPKGAPQHRHWLHATLVAQVIMVARACPFHGPQSRRSAAGRRLVS